MTQCVNLIPLYSAPIKLGQPANRNGKSQVSIDRNRLEPMPTIMLRINFKQKMFVSERTTSGYAMLCLFHCSGKQKVPFVSRSTKDLNQSGS